jgi:kynurenine formamidase
VTDMGHESSEIMRITIAQKERHTTRHPQLSALMEYGLGHHQGAFTHLDAQQHFGLGGRSLSTPRGATAIDTPPPQLRSYHRLSLH